MNLKIFFDKIRPLFGGKMNQSQVDGLNNILNACNINELTDMRMVAYILATVYHETAKTMQPIEEYGKGKGRAYNVVINGHVYYGRGYVQLTWDYNYKKAGKELNVDLLNNPELALQPDIAAKIMINGMVEGWFTGKKLKDYFNNNTDAVNARRIINGLDKAELIANYLKTFLTALLK